jgi:anthranilate synthase component I
MPVLPHPLTGCFFELESATLRGGFDPVLLHELNPKRYPFLLISAARTPNHVRDFIFAFPQEHIFADTPGFLERLEQAVAKTAAVPDDIAYPPGWLVFLGYELAREIEPILQRIAMKMDGVLSSFAVRIPAVVVIDHQLEHIQITAENAAMLRAICQDVKQTMANHQSPQITLPHCPIVEQDPQQFLDSVAKIHNYIRAGDVFQVNLSRRWQGDFTKPVSPAMMYRALRRSNPAPFSALVNFNGRAIVSSSPERLVRIKNRIADARPIAGTRRRDADPSRDTRLAAELLAHVKEQAEHVMLVDLERNDLGRVCQPGSITVNEMMQLESYTHVHHIVSNIQGKLRPEISPVDVLRATFPGGTITGCPKVRCMEIIQELETEPRGAYTGSLGFIDDRGDMDFNILIRTLELREQQVHFRAGAGIVYDSKAEHELKETRHKAEGLLRALQ